MSKHTNGYDDILGIFTRLKTVRVKISLLYIQARSLFFFLVLIAVAG